MDDSTVLRELIAELKAHNLKDLHVTRAFGVFVAVSDAKVIRTAGRPLEYCPLASLLYGGLDGEEMAGRATEEKIRKFGYFTAKRELLRTDIAVPYGTSERLMHALRDGVIDGAVTACDGAGTVVTSDPEVVQGIGARMNGIFYTTPIPEIVDSLAGRGSIALGEIDQARGVERALERGCRKIAVTVNGLTTSDGELERIESLAAGSGARVFIEAVCTTGVSREKAETLLRHVDIACSCASKEMRELGDRARLQITAPIPIFVYTQDGLELLAAYVKEGREHIEGLPSSRQFLISGCHKGEVIHIGHRCCYLAEVPLPVRDAKEPRPLR